MLWLKSANARPHSRDRNLIAHGVVVDHAVVVVHRSQILELLAVVEEIDVIVHALKMEVW